MIAILIGSVNYEWTDDFFLLLSPTLIPATRKTVKYENKYNKCVKLSRTASQSFTFQGKRTKFILFTEKEQIRRAIPKKFSIVLGLFTTAITERYIMGFSSKHEHEKPEVLGKMSKIGKHQENPEKRFIDNL